MIEGSDVKNGIQEAVSKLQEPFLILEWATGTGKTRASLKVSKGLKTLILCKQEKHFKTWTDEMERWDLYPSEYVIKCYNSLSKLAGEHFDIVLMDECHCLSEARLKALQQVSFSYLVGLSATIPQEVMFRLKMLGKPRVIKIPVNKAIEWKLIPSPKINVIECPLDNTRRYLKYQRHQKRFPPGITTIQYNEWNNYKLKFMNLDVICTEQEYYNLLEDEFIAARKTFFEQPDCKAKPENMCKQTQFFYNNFLQKGGMRKKFLGVLRTKYVQALMKKLEGQRLVIFANDIEQCNTLGQGYPVVHSKSSDKGVVEQFNNYKLDKLFSVRQLDESMNLEGEFSAIVVSLGGSSIQGIQRLGRALRSDDSQIFIFRTLNTRDDSYFKTFKEGLDDSYFTFLKINEIYG